MTVGWGASGAAHPMAAECAVVGVRDELKGQVPRGFVVLKAGVEADPEQLRKELVQSEIGAVAALREITDGKNPDVPSAIKDATILEKLAPILRHS